MKIKEVITYLEQIAPPQYQESYDNAGLIVGDASAEVTGVLCCLDSTEAVVEEAVARGCNLVVAHHPIVFRGLKQITGRNYVERVVIQAIRKEVAIYAIHTNLDNVYHQGVNSRIAEKIGLTQTRILAPKQVQKKLVTHIPASAETSVRNELQAAGGQVSDAWPAPSPDNGQAPRLRLEVTFASGSEHRIRQALQAYQPAGTGQTWHSIENPSPEVGSGLIGLLPKPMSEKDFLLQVKKAMSAACIRHTEWLGRPVQRVALCGGAGSFLLSQAIRRQADVFITGDYKYHEFFDADGRILIADIGHYESEQYTIELLCELISRKFSNFAAYCTGVNTNPVRYLC